MNNEALLSLKFISKSFPGVKALSNIDFSINEGEIISIVGQNGAGKSTLMSIIAGLQLPDEGEIYIDGKKVIISNAAIADGLRIGIVHQEPSLVSTMSVFSNIFLGREKLRSKVFLNFKKMKTESTRIMRQIGFNINPNSLIEDLNLVEREVVEIAKALLFNPRILILDEVTAPLGIQEVKNLFKLIRELKNKGIGIIFISHRLNEVIELSDKIVVIRDGKKVSELKQEDNISEKEIIRFMLDDRTIENLQINSSDRKGSDSRNLLRVSNLTKNGLFNNINFELQGAEIIGLAGLKGSGVSEILRTIFGLIKKDSGTIFFKEEKINIKNPQIAMQKGIGMITNDRHKEGLALIRSIEENITISSLDRLSNKISFLKPGLLKSESKIFVDSLKIKLKSLTQEVMFLSGGNQQKVVLAKLLLKDLQVIIVDEPTRGVDVDAKNEIHKFLLKLKEDNKGILITSPEIPELLKVCDKIIVISMGEIVRIINRDDSNFSEHDILEIMHIKKDG